MTLHIHQTSHIFTFVFNLSFPKLSQKKAGNFHDLCYQAHFSRLVFQNMTVPAKYRTVHNGAKLTFTFTRPEDRSTVHLGQR